MTKTTLFNIDHIEHKNLQYSADGTKLIGSTYGEVKVIDPLSTSYNPSNTIPVAGSVEKMIELSLPDINTTDGTWTTSNYLFVVSYNNGIQVYKDKLLYSELNIENSRDFVYRAPYFFLVNSEDSNNISNISDLNSTITTVKFPFLSNNLGDFTTRPSDWAPNTVYNVGDVVIGKTSSRGISDDPSLDIPLEYNIYVCTQGGTSSDTMPQVIQSDIDALNLNPVVNPLAPPSITQEVPAKYINEDSGCQWQILKRQLSKGTPKTQETFVGEAIEYLPNDILAVKAKGSGVVLFLYDTVLETFTIKELLSPLKKIEENTHFFIKYITSGTDTIIYFNSGKSLISVKIDSSFNQTILFNYQFPSNVNNLQIGTEKSAVITDNKTYIVDINKMNNYNSNDKGSVISNGVPSSITDKVQDIKENSSSYTSEELMKNYIEVNGDKIDVPGLNLKDYLINNDILYSLSDDKLFIKNLLTSDSTVIQDIDIAFCNFISVDNNIITLLGGTKELVIDYSFQSPTIFSSDSFKDSDEIVTYDVDNISTKPTIFKVDDSKIQRKIISVNASRYSAVVKTENKQLVLPDVTSSEALAVCSDSVVLDDNKIKVIEADRIFYPKNATVCQEVDIKPIEDINTIKDNLRKVKTYNNIDYILTNNGFYTLQDDKVQEKNILGKNKVSNYQYILDFEIYQDVLIVSTNQYIRGYNLDKTINFEYSLVSVFPKISFINNNYIIIVSNGKTNDDLNVLSIIDRSTGNIVTRELDITSNSGAYIYNNILYICTSTGVMYSDINDVISSTETFSLLSTTSTGYNSVGYLETKNNIAYDLYGANQVLVVVFQPDESIKYLNNSKNYLNSNSLSSVLTYNSIHHYDNKDYYKVYEDEGLNYLQNTYLLVNETITKYDNTFEVKGLV